MTLPTLLLLQRCLYAQTLTVGDPAFADTASNVLLALVELNAAITAAAEGPPEAAKY